MSKDDAQRCFLTEIAELEDVTTTAVRKSIRSATSSIRELLGEATFEELERK